MKFKKALKKMKKGAFMKRPSWGGYWRWDKDHKTIIMLTRDGKVMDIRETERVDYTLDQMLADDWIEATAENCTVLGGHPTFNFPTALRYMDQGLKVKRLSVSTDSFIELYEGRFTSPDRFYALTIDDILATDWTFAD